VTHACQKRERGHGKPAGDGKQIGEDTPETITANTMLLCLQRPSQALRSWN